MPAEPTEVGGTALTCHMTNMKFLQANIGHRKCDNNVGEERREEERRGEREHGLDCEKSSNDDEDEDNDDDDSESSDPKAPASQIAQFFHFLPPFFPFEAMFLAKYFTVFRFSIFSLHVYLLTRHPPPT